MLFLKSKGLPVLALTFVAASTAWSQSAIDLLNSVDPALRESLAQQVGAGGDAASQAVPGGIGSVSSAQYLSLIERQQEKERLEARAYRPSDTVVIDVSVLKADRPARTVDQGMGVPALEIPARTAPKLSDAEQAELERLVELVRSRNPYRLDNDGALVLPGFAPIPLAGLTDEQATLRLGSEPGLLKLDVRVTKLPLTQLRPFGYDFFDVKKRDSRDSPLAPAQGRAPAPNNYVLGVGDELRVQLYGGQNRSLRLTVTRDGVVNFPELGPIPVAGKSLAAVIGDIESRVESQIIGTRASVSVGQTRGVQVFVLGEAQQPGSYSVGENGTVTSAIFAAGGVKETGSLRLIEIKRGGETVRRVDLYDLLLRGDTREDLRLSEGDVVFIPPVGPTVTVEGEVRRSAIYELRGETTVESVLSLAGGLTPIADRSRVVISQTDAMQRRVLANVSLLSGQASGIRVGNGDNVRVFGLRPVVDSAVAIEGHVYRPGLVAWREGLRLADVVTSLDDLKPNADVQYVIIRRERVAERRVEVISASVAAALADPTSSANLILEQRDRIIVLDEEGGRRQLLEPLLGELRRQSTLQSPTAIVSVGGQVKAPGDYPLEIGMRVSDLLRAGGRLRDSAFGASAELARRQFVSGRWETELLSIDLAAILRGDATANVTLQPGDNLIVKQAPDWLENEAVTLGGEVRFPGVYPIRRGETLRSVIERAGGLTELANPQGSVFTREELRQLEKRELDRLTERLQRDLAASALLNAQAVSGSGAASVLTLAQSVLAQLKDTTPVGRLVIDLNQVMSARLGSSDDIVLRPGDQLFVPKFRQEVSVIGEVQNVTAHLHREGFDLDDYLALSGGLSSKADKKRIFVVRADGSVRPSKASGWTSLLSKEPIRPGDTIVVPLDTESLPTLARVQLWQAATSVLYNSAVAFAAIRGL